MKRMINVTFLLLLAFSPAVGAEEKSTVFYNAAVDRLTFNLHDMPIKKALSLIAGEVGFEVFIDEGVEARVSLRLSEVPLETGLRRLLKGINHVMIFGGNAAPKVETIKVYGEGKAVALRHPSPPARSPSSRPQLNGGEEGLSKSDRGRRRSGRRSTGNREADVSSGVLPSEDPSEEQGRSPLSSRERREEERKMRMMKRWEHLKETDPEAYGRKLEEIERRFVRGRR